jgi:hypothetical protein
VIHRSRLILVAVVLLIAGSIAAFPVSSTSQTTFDFKPLGKNAPILTPSEVNALLGMQFNLVRHVRSVPSAVKQSFINWTGAPLDMADPGEPIGTDVIYRGGPPQRRLVFAALGDHCAILVYEQGGRGTALRAMAFSFQQAGEIWSAILNNPKPQDIGALRSAISEGRFQKWAPTL